MQMLAVLAMFGEGRANRVSVNRYLSDLQRDGGPFLRAETVSGSASAPDRLTARR